MKKMRTRYLKESTIKKNTDDAKRMLKATTDIKKLKAQGYNISANPFRVNSTSKKVMDDKLKKEKRENPERRILRRVESKLVQHPKKNIRVYIFVVKKLK